MHKTKVFSLQSNTEDNIMLLIFVLSFIRHCLELVDDSSLVANERSLIESQNICDFFRYVITPLESKISMIRNIFLS